MSSPRPLNRKRSVRSRIWVACGGKCHHCGVQLEPFTTFHLDHLVPLAMGGEDDESNIVGSCDVCNWKRGGRGSREARQVSAAEWLAEQTFEPMSMVKLRNYREALGLSQVEFSETLGVTQTTVSRWESGAKAIGNATILEYALRYLLGKKRDDINQALGVEPKELVSDE